MKFLPVRSSDNAKLDAPNTSSRSRSDGAGVSAGLDLNRFQSMVFPDPVIFDPNNQHISRSLGSGSSIGGV